MNASDSDYDDDNAISNTIKIPSSEVHEISKLIASWSKLASAGYITNKGQAEAEEAAEEQSENNNAIVLLTKKEKMMAAEKAEECLRYLVNCNSSSIVTMDMYHSVSANSWGSQLYIKAMY